MVIVGMNNYLPLHIFGMEMKNVCIEGPFRESSGSVV
jgi:hypothetical protein